MVVWKSDHPPLKIPTDLTTWQWAFESEKYSPLLLYPENELGFYENCVTKERLNYAAVKQHATALSTALVDGYNLRPGQTVTIFAPNTVWYPVALWATVRVGARINGASPAYNADEMSHALKTADTKLIFTMLGSLDTAVAAAKQAGLPEDRIFLLEGGRDGFRSIKDLISQGARTVPTPVWQLPSGQTNKDVCGYLNFSSGTTGLPKAVMLSHHNIIAQCHQLRQLQIVEPDENYRIPAVTPLFHITGLVRFIHYPLFMNGWSIMLPSFDLDLMLRTTISYGIRELILVPPIIIRLVRDDDVVGPHLPALRRTVKRWSSGSAPISPEIIALLHRRFPNTGFRQGYGATESTACITCHPPSHYDYEYAASAGKLVANTSAKILSLPSSSSAEEPRRELGANEIGELLARGPQIATLGYLSNPSATAETFDPEGYFHTGDVGYFDAGTGLLHVVDRIKEMIKVRGQQVAPAELESALLGHGAVGDCAVVGVGDGYSGEKPKAYVVLKEGWRASEGLGRELMRHVRERKARFKWLAEVEFTEALPKNSTGKLLRRVLREGERNADRVGGLRVREEGRGRAARL